MTSCNCLVFYHNGDSFALRIGLKIEKEKAVNKNRLKQKGSFKEENSYADACWASRLLAVSGEKRFAVSPPYDPAFQIGRFEVIWAFIVNEVFS